MNSKSSSGFTLIELMVGVAVLGVLLAIGVPSFRDMVERNRVSSAAADYASAVGFARAEAVARGTAVSLIAQDTSSPADWGLGWCVAQASPADCTGTIIRTFPFGGGVNISSAADILTFDSRGFLTGGAAVLIDFCGSTTADRRVRVNASGQATIAVHSC